MHTFENLPLNTEIDYSSLLEFDYVLLFLLLLLSFKFKIYDQNFKMHISYISNQPYLSH